MNDLEELEYFMKQRVVELQSKDQAMYAVFQENINKIKSKEYLWIR